MKNIVGYENTKGATCLSVCGAGLLGMRNLESVAKGVVENKKLSLAVK